MKSIKKFSAIIVAFAFIGLASSFSAITTNFYMANHLPYAEKFVVNFADGSNTVVMIPGGGAAYTLNTGGKSVVSTTVEGITVPVGVQVYFTDQLGKAAVVQGDGCTGGSPIDPHELS